VFAAAVVLDPGHSMGKLNDSKLLAPGARERIAGEIKDKAVAWAVASASVAEIDRINILEASLLAMRRAIEALGVEPGEVAVDGLYVPAVPFKCRAIVKGDRLVAAISAASILAKVARDAEMVALHERYPQYGFAEHKGYASPEHLAALREHGPCEIHRRTFEPILPMLLQPELPL
jgi:ribonuclease HII